MEKVMLLPVTANQYWKAMLADLVNSLDDLLFTFDGRRRMGESEIQSTVERWKDGGIFTVLDPKEKQHIGVAGWHSVNMREGVAHAWIGLGLTNNRPDEKEFKSETYQKLVTAIFDNIPWVQWVFIKTRLESKDSPILRDIGFNTANEFGNYLFVDGKYVSMRLHTVGRP